MKPSFPIIVFLLAFCMTGCASYSAVAVSSTSTVVPTSTPSCSADTIPNFTNYAAWTKVNPKPIKGHEVFVNIYVNDLARDIYLSASGETFPECAMIVKPHLESADSNKVTAITVMVKMPAGFDPENNDWWWGMYDKDGKVAEMSGKVPVCVACHKPVAATDYVFSQKVMEEINK